MKTQEERLRAALDKLEEAKRELGFARDGDSTAEQMAYWAIDHATVVVRAAWHLHYQARKAIEESEAVPA